MNEQVLSIEQMQYLTELGIDTSKASMIWILLPECFWIIEKYYVAVRESFEKKDDENIPAFSLQDMLSMMPNVIDEDWHESNLTIFFYKDSVSICYEDDYENQVASFCEDSLLKSAYLMLCWLAENGYLNKK